MDEVGSKTSWRRYNETAKWALVDAEPGLSSEATILTKGGVSTISYGPKGSKLSVKVQHSPLRISQLRDGKEEVVLNDRSLLHMEHFRLKEEEEKTTEEVEGLSENEQVVLASNSAERRWFEEEDKDLWEERFRQWTDVKPKGELSDSAC